MQAPVWYILRLVVDMQAAIWSRFEHWVGSWLDRSDKKKPGTMSSHQARGGLHAPHLRCMSSRSLVRGRRLLRATRVEGDKGVSLPVHGSGQVTPYVQALGLQLRAAWMGY
jgi:hypothetical protein